MRIRTLAGSFLILGITLTSPLAGSAQQTYPLPLVPSTSAPDAVVTTSSQVSGCQNPSEDVPLTTSTSVSQYNGALTPLLWIQFSPGSVLNQLPPPFNSGNQSVLTVTNGVSLAAGSATVTGVLSGTTTTYTVSVIGHVVEEHLTYLTQFNFDTRTETDLQEQSSTYDIESGIQQFTFDLSNSHIEHNVSGYPGCVYTTLNTSSNAGSQNFLASACPATAAKIVPVLGPQRSRDGYPTNISAAFSPNPGAPISLTAAAVDCNVAQFDWQQTITSWPTPSTLEAAQPSAGCLGPLDICVAPPSFFDPPPGGYDYFLDDLPLYNSFYQAYPFYYNSTILLSGCAVGNGTTCSVPITSINGDTLNFFDSPNQPTACIARVGSMCTAFLPLVGNMDFTTSLVGVLPNGSVGPVFKSFSWTSTYHEGLGGVQSASSVPVDGSGFGGITITDINGVPQTPPTTTCTATPNTLWPPNGMPVVVTVSGSITAGTSKLVTSTYKVIDSYGQVQPTGNITLTSGAYSFGIPLIAARNGDDKDGRTYTIVAMGSDTIGNVGACSAVVTVPHDKGN